MQENITFKMILVSHLAAADCASGVAGNIDISKHTCTIIYQNQNQNQNPLLTSLYTHNKYMAYVNSSEMLTIYLVLVVHE